LGRADSPSFPYTEDDVRKLLSDADYYKNPVTVNLDGLPHNISRELPRNKDWNLDVAESFSPGQQALNNFKNRAVDTPQLNQSQSLER
jgi:hypothetical protein